MWLDLIISIFFTSPNIFFTGTDCNMMPSCHQIEPFMLHVIDTAVSLLRLQEPSSWLHLFPVIKLFSGLAIAMVEIFSSKTPLKVENKTYN